MTKQIKLSLLAIFLIVSTTIFSNNKYKISINNDMLVFEKIQDYTAVIRDFNKEQKVEFMQFLASDMNFNKLANFPQSTLFSQLNDGFIELLVNQHGYIQIADNVYKIDPTNEKTAVVHLSKYLIVKPDLDNGIYNNPLVRGYGIDEDVIKLVESNIPPNNGKLFCGESGAGGDSKSGHIDCKDPQTQASCNWMDCWVKYVHAGIYFGLSAKCENRSPCRELVWHKTPAAYKVKCGYSYGPVYQWDIRTNAVGNSGYVWNQYFYQNVQPLNAFWLRVVFMAKDPSWIGNPDNPSVDLEIRKNM